MGVYVADPAKWDRLAERLAQPAAWPLGVDSETYNQPDKTSPQWRARVHCWSLGVYTDRRHPRGYRIAQGLVLPREALDHPGLRSLLERADIPKLAHNAPHDYHSLVNEGVRVQGLEDTLQWSRVALPSLWCGYGLKELEVHVLGKAVRPTFKQVTALSYLKSSVRRHKERGCICGATPCRARATADWWDGDQGWWRQHTRVTWRRFTVETKPAVRQREVPEMVPGCEGWDQWEAYSLADAVGVLELADYLSTRPAKWTAKVWPWHAPDVLVA
jgi:hypothetical protein